MASWGNYGHSNKINFLFDIETAGDKKIDVYDHVMKKHLLVYVRL